MRGFTAFFALLLLITFSFAQNAVSKLKAGDLVELIVYDFPDYGGEYTVFEDGSINGRGFGRVFVAGKTVEDAEKLVRSALARTLNDPSISLILKKERPSMVYVTGAVGEKPGTFELVPGMDLRQLVATVRLPEDPDLLEGTLYRGTDRRPVDLQRLLSGHPDEWNGRLEPNDLLVILPKSYVRVWVTGLVGSPGEFRVRNGTDVQQAIALAGGLKHGEEILQDELTVRVRRGTDFYTLSPSNRGFLVAAAGGSGQGGPFTLESGDVVSVDPPSIIKVSIAGEVRDPGEYNVRAGAPIASVIAQARGLMPEGSLSSIAVFRGTDVYSVDASSLATGEGAPNFSLQNGDSIYVRPSDRVVFIMGPVARPGRYLIPDGRTWRANDLLAQAGGLRDRSASYRRVRLIRPGPDGKYESREFHLDEFLKDVNMDSNPLLQPGDILLFGDSRPNTIGTLSQILSTAFLFDTLFRRW
jgi:protein involved in polysaccharide export with SLBB domain